VKAYFVTKRLAFGSKATRRRHIERLHTLGITHIIDVRKYQTKKLKDFKRLSLPFKDNARPRPAWFYRRALSLYVSAMKQPGSKVFTMCRMGRRRSASMAYFLLRASGYPPKKAAAAVRKARPCACIVGAYRESGEEFLRRMRRWQNV
jgi:hypothetical protein